MKSEDFFDALNYPKIKFKSTGIQKVNDEKYTMKGLLTIKEVSKEITLNVEFGGIIDDPYGNTKAGFEITGTINRKDFGITWSAMTESGGIVVGDEVKLNLNIEAVLDKSNN